MGPMSIPEKDPELLELFRQDPSLLELAAKARRGRPSVAPAPIFVRNLRMSLVSEATRRQRRYFLFQAPAVRLAWGAAFVGVILGAAGLASLSINLPKGQQLLVVASSNVSAQHSVALNDTITVSFNQPMDHASVVQALHIQPATAYTTRWNGNSLLIHPLHGLAADTPYKVTISASTARTASGAIPARSMYIAFGTQPKPQPSPTVTVNTPTVVPVQVGTALGGTSILATGSGTIVGAGTLPAGSTEPASSTGSGGSSPLTGTASPGVSPASGASPSPSQVTGSEPGNGAGGSSGGSGGTASQQGAAQNGATELLSPAGNPVTVLGPPSAGLALSPDGSTVAAIGTGSGTIFTITGSKMTATRFVADTSSALCWDGNSHLLFSHDGSLVTASLSSLAQTTAPLPAGTTISEFAPGCGYAVLTAAAVPTSTFPTGTPPSGTAAATPGPTPLTTQQPPASSAPASSSTPDSAPELLDIATGGVTQLTGLAGPVTFTSDGATMAWLNSAGSSPVIEMAAAGNTAATTIPVPIPAGLTPTSLALSPSGSLLAVGLAGQELPTAQTGVELASVPSGVVIATVPATAVQGISWTPAGDQLAFTEEQTAGALTVAQATLPASLITPPSQQAGLLDTVTKLLNAEVSGDTSAVYAKLAPGAVFSGTVPPDLNRGYMISYYQSAPSQITATARLVTDFNSQGQTAAYANEEITLVNGKTPGTFSITGVSISGEQPVGPGPMIISAALSQSPSATTIAIGFDSDLEPSTTANAVTVTTGNGTNVLVTTRYDVNTRTLIISAGPITAGTITVSLGSSITDLNGHNLSSYTVQLSA